MRTALPVSFRIAGYTIPGFITPGFIILGLVVGIIAAPQSLSAQSFDFPTAGFTSANVCANSSTPAESCQILTNGQPNQPFVTSSNVLRLNPAQQNQHGSVWYSVPQPLSTGFTTAFQFQISSTNSCWNCSFPADGMALVIQNDPAGTGALGYTGDGQNMSYGNNDAPTASGPGNAILNSLAIELDTYQNTNYRDPNGNHIAVQSCGPNNASVLTANSADHEYLCPDGNVASLALQPLPSGMSLSDGKTHTLTVNYLPAGNCTSACNNLSVYFDSTLILQATVDITKQLSLTGNGSAYIGITAATGASVENNDIVSWTFSSLPLAPITINQPLQPTVTNFNFTSALSEMIDYSQSGLNPNLFNGVVMQGTVQSITDQTFADLVDNTPFQGSTCQHQDTGGGNYACVITTDLCTTSTNSTPSGANCPNTGTNALINVTNTYNLDPSQKPIVAPGYLMGTDTALNCGATGDNTCKGLVNIFSSISGDAVSSGGHTNSFNSILVPILGAVLPSTAATTVPALNNGWTNGSVTLNLNSTEAVPPNNTNPPPTLPAITSINYSATGANVPSPASGTLPGNSGSILIPATAQGATTVTFYATDNAGSNESVVTNSGGQVSSATPSITINVDTIPPTLSCAPPAPMWQATDVTVPCTASDNAGGSGLVGPSSFNVSTNVPAGTETNAATIPAVTVQDVAGNTSAPAGPFGPFDVDKKAPVITGPSLSPSSPVFGQSVTANYSCTDGGSGVVLCGPSGSPSFPATASTGPLSSAVPSSTGSHTFTVLAQDAVGNQSVPSSVTYTIGQATPVITWPAPAPIPYGTLLSSAQLDATANVPGTFVYSPPAGTLLPEGNQTLSVTFTPTDSVDYTTASAQVTLLVTAPPINLSPANLDFGTQLIGKIGLLVETVSNPNSVPLSITGIKVILGSGSARGDFQLSNSCGHTLAPGRSCTVAVYFVSPNLGEHSATLEFMDNAIGSPQQIPITANVIQLQN